VGQQLSSGADAAGVRLQQQAVQEHGPVTQQVWQQLSSGADGACVRLQQQAVQELGAAWPGDAAGGAAAEPRG